MRAAGLEHLGIYHSHPLGDNAPSPADIERAFYPDVAYLIVSLDAEPARAIRAFRIRRGLVGELEVRPV
jgi:proteasome lid subunit RPN8/RPN11